MSKEIPILFSTPMVQAILEGRKTQTRRIVKQHIQREDIGSGASCFSVYDSYGAQYYNEQETEPYTLADFQKWKPGDLLWVRETWTTEGHTTKHYAYRADHDSISNVGRWKPSIHMPKTAARIWLQVESVGVERLQDISEEDAISEGINWIDVEPEVGMRAYRDYVNCENDFLTPIQSYATLWQSINGPESWEQNPFVWVIKFKRIERG